MTTEEHFEEWLKTQKKMFADPLDFAEYYHKAKIEAISDEMIAKETDNRFGEHLNGIFLANRPKEMSAFRKGAKWFKEQLLKQ